MDVVMDGDPVWSLHIEEQSRVLSNGPGGLHGLQDGFKSAGPG